MDDQQIEQLFEKIAAQYDFAPEAAKQIFTTLVKLTLKQRDLLVTHGDPPLTITEVQTGLDELLKVMQTRQFSPEVPARIRQLVTLWFEELKHQLDH